MEISPAQTIAAAGLLTGYGLAPNQSMVQQFQTHNALPLIKAVDDLYKDVPTPTIDNVPGLQASIDQIPSWASGRKVGGTKVSTAANNQANQIIGSGTSGIQNFGTHLSVSGSYGTASLNWAAAIASFSGKSFPALGLHNRSFLDISTGGVTGRFGGMATVPGGPQNGMMMLGGFIASLGRSINLNNMKKALGAGPFIVRMRENGLGNIGGLNYTLSSLNIFSDDEVLNTNEQILKGALQTVNNPDDVRLVISTLEIKVPPRAQIRTLADLVDANKMIPPALRTLTPTGNLSDLNGALGGLGGDFRTQQQLSQFLGRTEVPALQFLGGLTNPVPPNVISILKPAIGQGSITYQGRTQPLGTGPLGNPTMTDMLGIAAGKGITDNFRRINGAHSRIMGSAPGQNLRLALINLYQADRTSNPNVLLFKDALDVAIANFNIATKNDPTIRAAEVGMVSSVLQLDRSTQLLALAGVNLTSPSPQANKVGVMQLAASLPKFGVDRNSMGYRALLSGMADNRNVFGEAVNVALMEGRNTDRQKKSGVPNNILADVALVTAGKIAVNTAAGLTPQQKQNVVDDARAMGKDPDTALKLATTFGYNNDYYQRKGYPSA